METKAIPRVDFNNCRLGINCHFNLSSSRNGIDVMKQGQSFLMVVSRVLGADDDRHSIGTRYSHLQNTLSSLDRI